MGRARTSSLLVLLTGAGRTGGCRWLVPVFVAVGVAAVQEHQTRAVAERYTADLAISHHGETALVSLTATSGESLLILVQRPD